MSHGCLPRTWRRRCSHQSGTQRHLPDQKNYASNPRKKLCLWHFVTSMVWCTMSSYRLDRMLMVISKCKFFRGCERQFGGNGTTSDREGGFCIMIMHRTTHRLLCSNSSPRKAFLSSPNHCTLQISLQVNLALPYSENGSQGDVFHNHGGHQIECEGRTPEDSKRSLPPVFPTMAGLIEQVCVCVRARKDPALK